MFNLSSVTNISSAKVRIFASISANGTGSSTYYTVADTNWAETGITWNNKPPRSNALNHVRVTSTTAAWFTNDITAFVQGEKAVGRNLISLALHSQTNASIFTRINSRQAASNRVEIIVTTTNSPPTVLLTNPAAGAIFSTSSGIPITAEASDAGGAIAQVEFFQGGTSLGVRTSPPYSLTWTNVAAGSYSLSARATDNLGVMSTSAPVAITVDSPPSVTLDSPAGGTLFIPPVSILLIATAANNNGPVTRVEFHANGVKIGETNQLPFQAYWTNPTQGSATLWAVAFEANGLSTSSATRVISVDGRIPAAWLQQYFGASYATNPNALPDADPDGDGLSNWIEYLQGRDPTVGAVADTGGVIGLRVFTPLR